jgi:hypothetical protein
MLGPIDYIAVGFEGNNFDGSILSELSKAVESGAIRVVDLVFIIKDADGNVLMAEAEDQHEDLKSVVETFGIDGDLPLIAEQDIEKLGESMKNDSSAGVLVIEHLWAKGLKKALIDAGGVLVAEGRLLPVAVLAAVEELEQTKESE